MGRVTRPHPRRPAWLYPEGTTLEIRGRVFEVVQPYYLREVDPSYGHGGPVSMIPTKAKKIWRQISKETPVTQRELPLHHIEAGGPRCETCNQGECYDCTDLS